MTKVAINGFGRIGRLVARAILERPDSGLELVAINDLADARSNAWLFKRDSVHGAFPGEVSAEGNDIVINGKRIKVTAERDPAKLPHGDNGVDIALECTGFFTSRDGGQKHVEAGARRVLISAPAKGADLTVVYGVNDDKLTAEHKIVSNASCTTNCLAPVAKVMNDTIGIERGLMTTIHAYTNDQKILDQIHSDPRRARAAAMSIIPTTTGAARAVGRQDAAEPAVGHEDDDVPVGHQLGEGVEGNRVGPGARGRVESARAVVDRAVAADWLRRNQNDDGGFGNALTPWFSPSNLAWMEMGGIYAVANLRGGGEYGKAWHDAGRLANKQNVFDDFIAAAEWLIANKYTSSERLAVQVRDASGQYVTVDPLATFIEGTVTGTVTNSATGEALPGVARATVSSRCRRSPSTTASASSTSRWPAPSRWCACSGCFRAGWRFTTRWWRSSGS